jgi:hypothetical protein
MDWNYPFDFSGSIYRLSSVEDILTKILPQEQMLNPKTFEYAGNKAIKYNMLAKTQPYSLCLNWPVVTIITINKVQDNYNTPVYPLKAVETPKKSSIIVDAEEETKDVALPSKVLNKADECLL